MEVGSCLSCRRKLIPFWEKLLKVSWSFWCIVDHFRRNGSFFVVKSSDSSSMVLNTLKYPRQGTPLPANLVSSLSFERQRNDRIEPHPNKISTFVSQSRAIEVRLITGHRKPRVIHSLPNPTEGKTSSSDWNLGRFFHVRRRRGKARYS